MLQQDTREIRAQYDNETIIVYQAYNAAIANVAIISQTFVPPLFKKERMTWIKPSFMWMMYRSGWATKPGQEHVLRIKLKREGFDWALSNSCLSHFDSRVHSSYEDWKQRLAHAPVRVQWDPERDIHLQPLQTRAIQVGLSGVAVEKYIKDWIVEISDITATCKKIRELVSLDACEAVRLLPEETTYPVSVGASKLIGLG